MQDAVPGAKTREIIDPLRGFCRGFVADVNQRVMHSQDQGVFAQERQRQQVEPHVTQLQVNDVRIESPNLPDKAEHHLQLTEELPDPWFNEDAAFDRVAYQMQIGSGFVLREEHENPGIFGLRDTTRQACTVLTEIKCYKGYFHYLRLHPARPRSRRSL